MVYFNGKYLKERERMRKFNYSKFKDVKWDSEVLSLISGIYKYQGKEEFFLKQKPEQLNKLVEIAKIQSTESSNEIEGIVTTSTRIKKLVEEKTSPRNRDEKEIIGYRDVLNLIHENFDVIPVSKNYILQMHKIMFSYLNNPFAGKTKNVQNYITATYENGHSEVFFTPLSPFETSSALDDICDEFNKVIGNWDVDPLIAIPLFIHDFLCIHPFNDGNGRMSRLLTTLLLYKCNFYVGRYISLESIIAKSKFEYYDSLAKSDLNWHNEKEDILPFLKYILGIILSAYKAFEDRFSIIEEKLPAIEIVRKAINQKIEKFSKQDIVELCPNLSLSSIENSLRKLVEEEVIKREGIGKAIKYIRLK
ncbi:Fic family protein [Mycoplasmopsis pullorum]|uniref:Fic family protein n=1 Tax=Mycoplasmopsis pullorum TaxID=48003 RepID=UPI001F3FC229|nr:Fic family protein [Mycoplasmopsis pullorum]